MPAPTRDLIVNLVGKTNKLMSPFESASAQMAGIGRKLTKTLTPAAAAIGAGMALAGREFNKGVDALRVGTGAIGPELDTLTNQMKSLASNSSIARLGVGRVGEILADVSTTTGATGKDLENLTTKFAQLERMGIGADIQNIARVFGDWGIATENQAATMEKLFLAAQNSGASIDTLASNVVEYGAAMRNLGFAFEETLALFASFEKNGVNLATVMSGLKAGIGKLAKAGEDVPATFRRIVKEIENTESASKATGLAIELFGQRAGPDLADAIQNGQFAVEDMITAIESGSDSINAAAEDTARLADQIAALKNRVVGFLGPFGEMGAVVAAVLVAIGPLLLGLAHLPKALLTVRAAALAMNTALLANPFAWIAIAIITIATLIFFHRDKVLRALTAAWDAVKLAADKTWEAIKLAAEKTWEAIKLAFTKTIDFFVKFPRRVWDALIDLDVMVFGWLKVKIKEVKEWFNDELDELVGFFTELPGKIWNGIKAVNAMVFEWMKDLITGVKDWFVEHFDELIALFTDFPDNILTALGDLSKTLFGVGKDLIMGLWDGIKSMFGWLGDKLGGFFSGVLPGWAKKALGISTEKSIGEILSEARGGGLDQPREPRGPRPGMAAMAGAAPQTFVTQVMLDGRQIAETQARWDRRTGGVIR